MPVGNTVVLPYGYGKLGKIDENPVFPGNRQWKDRAVSNRSKVNGDNYSISRKGNNPGATRLFFGIRLKIRFFVFWKN